MKLIVKLFAEISIKSPSVRKKMIRTLQSNIRAVLRHHGVTANVQRLWDRIEIEADDVFRDAAVEALARTPGIAHLLEVRAIRFETFEDIATEVVPAWSGRIAGRSFRVSVRRTGRGHGFTSIDLERWLGARLLEAVPDARVRLTAPDVDVRLEIADDEAFLVIARHEGMGGYPLGEPGDALCLLSGGFDSGVAAWLTLRRGIRTHFVFFNLGGTAHEIGVQQAAWYLWERFGPSYKAHFISIPFDEVVEEILARMDHGLMGVALKRLMLRAADRVARRLGVDTLVTGESVSQVSSQTLHNLTLIDRASECLILRPLALMDKNDIIDLARRIGTEPYAASMPEYCGVISDRPSVHVDPQRLASDEAALSDGLIERAVARATHHVVATLVEHINEQAAVPVTSLAAPDDLILDIRLPSQRSARPMPDAPCPVEAIPFPELSGRASRLPYAARYLLYCDRGVLGQLHGQHLRDRGIGNAWVWRPEKSSPSD